jgi:hypothetical protein
MADLQTMRAQLDGLLAMRWRGVRETMIEGRRVSYASDAELAVAIADLERRIAVAEGNGRRGRVLRPYAVKDL